MNLTDKVEIMRNLLHDVIINNDSDLILKISQDLDDLIVEYYKAYYRFH